MAELITSLLLEVVAKSAFKALLTHRPPDADEWASAVTALLKTLTAENSAVDDALARIDTKLDNLAQQSLTGHFGTAKYFLDIASASTPGPERQRDLEQARIEFVAARQSATAYSLTTQAIVKWYLAMTCLLLGRAEECHNTLIDARDDSARAVLEVLGKLHDGDPDYRALARERQPRGLAGLMEMSTDRDKRLAAAKKVAQTRHLTAQREAAQLCAAIEAVRARLGVPESQCRPLRVDTIWPEVSRGVRRLTFNGISYVSADLVAGPNELLHIGIEIHRAIVRLDKFTEFKSLGTRPNWFVDIDLELVFPPDCGFPQCAPTAKANAGRGGAIEFQTSTLPDLPQPQLPTTLIPERVSSPAVIGRAGKCVRGWARCMSVGDKRPEVVALRLWPFLPADASEDQLQLSKHLEAVASLDSIETSY